MNSNIISLLTKFIIKYPGQIKNVIYPVKVILSKEIRRIQTTKKYDIQDDLPFIDLTDLIPNFHEEIENYTFLDESSLITDIAIIKALCQKHTDCHYLEIGSWRGESLYNASRVSKQCVSVSLPNDEVELRWGKRAAKVTRMFTRDCKNILHIESDSQKFDFNSLNLKFDVIFIDGDHSYQGVYNDTKKVYPLLRDEKSIILWHDCGQSYEKPNWEVLSAILDAMPNEEHKKLFRITNSLHAIYTREHFKTEMLQSPQFPTKVFSISIKASNGNIPEF